MSKFCVTHDEPVCNKCVVEFHKECQRITPLATIVDHWQETGRFHDVLERASNTNHNIEKLVQVLTGSKNSLTLSKSEVQRNIKDLRYRIDQHLDKLEVSINQQLEHLYQEESKDVGRLLQILDEIENKIMTICVDISDLFTEENQEERFLKIHMADRNLQHLKNDIEGVLTSTKSIDIKFTIDKTLESFLKDLKPFGKLNLVKSEVKPQLNDMQHKHAQVHVHCSESSPTILLSEEQEVKIDTNGSRYLITGCLSISDGRFLFIDRNSEVICIQDTNGDIERLAEVTDSPYDVALVNEKNMLLGITFGSKAYIDKIHFGERKESTRIPMNGFCSGICYSEGFFFTVVRSKGIFKVSLILGKCSLLIKVPAIDIGYISVQGDKLVYSNAKQRSVSCCKSSGEPLWVYKMEGTGCPRGVQLTRYFDVILVDSGFNEVVCISADGRGRKTLVKGSGLHEPFCLNLNVDTQRLLVSNLMNGKAFTYILKYR